MSVFPSCSSRSMAGPRISPREQEAKWPPHTAGRSDHSPTPGGGIPWLFETTIVPQGDRHPRPPHYVHLLSNSPSKRAVVCSILARGFKPLADWLIDGGRAAG